MKATFICENDRQAASNEEFVAKQSLWKSWRVFDGDNLDWGWILDIEIHKQEQTDYFCIVQTDYPELEVAFVTKGSSAAEALYKAFANILEFDTPFIEGVFDVDCICEIAVNEINHEIGTHNPLVSVVENS